MANVFVVMYVEQRDGQLSPPAYPMRFDLAIHEWWAGLGCVNLDGTANPNATTVTWTVVGEPFGNFAVCSLEVPDGWWGKYQAAQTSHEAVADSLNIAPSIPALAGRHRAIITAINRQLDDAGIPRAASDVERAVNGLTGLDFAGHHPGFELVRDCYLGALTVPPNPNVPVLHHWMQHVLRHGETMPNGETLIDFDMLGAMRQCMLDHPPAAPCRAVHYIYQLGLLALYLNSP